MKPFGLFLFIILLEKFNHMNRLVPVTARTDIFPELLDTPIGLLLEYHNLDREYESYSQAQLLIGMCMDNRKHLHIPDNFSFIIRAGGANLRNSEFKVSYAVAVGGVKSIALIGHNQCGMVNLAARRDVFVRGLVENAGWEPDLAEQHFLNYAPLFEIGNEVDFVLSEAKRLKARYPKVQVAPLLYKVEDNLLYQVMESN